MNLKFKSSEPDLKFNIQSQLRILNQNILYLTREVDKIVRLIKQSGIDKDLQMQVDKYFEEDHEGDGTGESHLGTDPTSPQTD